MNAAAALPPPLDVRLMNTTATVLFVGLALAALWACGGWLLRQPVFAVGRITVEGELNHTSAMSLRANVAPQLVGNFFTLDLEAARRAFEQVPWVRRAQVRREFPSGLRVALEEHDVAALWGAEGSGMLVNRHGEVFEADDSELDDVGLPRLSGPPERAAEMLQMVRQLDAALLPLGFAVDTLELSAHSGWRMQLASGATVVLGGGEPAQVLERVRRLVRTLPRVAQEQGRSSAALEHADLRHPGGYALRLRGVTTVSPEEAARAAARPTPRPAARRAATNN